MKCAKRTKNFDQIKVILPMIFMVLGCTMMTLRSETLLYINTSYCHIHNDVVSLWEKSIFIKHRLKLVNHCTSINTILYHRFEPALARFHKVSIKFIHVFYLSLSFLPAAKRVLGIKPNPKTVTQMVSLIFFFSILRYIVCFYYKKRSPFKHLQ